MGGSRSLRAVVVGVLLTLVCGLAACSTTVNGSGAPASGAPSGGFPSSPQTDSPSTGDTGIPSQGTSPTGTGGTDQPALTCPHVSIPHTAKLAFDCLVPGMKSGPSGDLWIYNWTVDTEPNWEASEGVTPGTQDLAGSLNSQLADLVSGQFYGPGATHTTPTITSVTVGGKKAQQLETTFTVAPAYRKQKSLKVVTEHLWMLAISVDTADSTLWYVSVPDTIKQYWAKVPALIKAIKVID